jgi:hypothetical protein
MEMECKFLITSWHYIIVCTEYNNISSPNNRVNNWLNDFGSNTPGVPSVLSQLSIGATASQLSLLSQNTVILKVSKFVQLYSSRN